MGAKKFLCPLCGEFSDVFIDSAMESVDFVVNVDGDVVDKAILNSEHVVAVCPVCREPYEYYHAEDFLVEVEEVDGSVVVRPIGKFWFDHGERLDDVARVKGFRVIISKDMLTD